MDKFLNKLVFEACRYNTSSFTLFARHRKECLKYGIDSYLKLHSKLSTIYSRTAKLWNQLYDKLPIYIENKSSKEWRLYQKFVAAGFNRPIPEKLIGSKPLPDNSPVNCSFADNLAENAYFHAKLLTKE